MAYDNIKLKSSLKSLNKPSMSCEKVRKEQARKHETWNAHQIEMDAKWSVLAKHDHTEADST